MKTWLTADWHLGEDRFALMGRPFTSVQEHIDTMAFNHNALVAPDDVVIVVGDVCYQKTPEYLPQVANFNGTKILIRGNHDRVLTDEQLMPYFHRIVPEGEGIHMEIEGIPCYITHYPSEGKFEPFNIVGHIHAAWKYQLNMLNVGVDVHHFRPVDAATIPFHKTAIEKFYDGDVWVAYNDINSDYAGIRGKAGTYFRPKA